MSEGDKETIGAAEKRCCDAAVALAKASSALGCIVATTYPGSPNRAATEKACDAARREVLAAGAELARLRGAT